LFTFFTVNISNTETTYWQTKSTDLYVGIITEGNSIFGEGTANYSYKTKEDKKTTFK